MSTVALEVGDLMLSASGVHRFTSCENKWYLHQQSDDPESGLAKSDALRLGTLMHRLIQTWWLGADWQTDWTMALREEEGWEPGFEAPSVFLRADKIMTRWEDVRGVIPDQSSVMVASELPFDLPLPGIKGVRVRGFLDGVLKTGQGRFGDHRLLEIKTMGRWGRENQVPWDPQLHLYLWAARQLFPVTGVEFEAISTYDYKSGDPERSFKTIPLEYNEKAVELQMENIRRMARRALVLLKKPNEIIRSIGDQCTWCAFRQQCLTPWETT